ncbi:hypothetical protein FOCC_FOCC013955 [Frankliniella occidentalis]|nr:hypothetical protein FOCC_FOCC013955 [Frankliniella occidentalis]
MGAFLRFRMASGRGGVQKALRDLGQNVLDNVTKVEDGDSILLLELKAQARQELATLPILSLICKCKIIVTFFKSSGLNLQLKKGRLRQEVDTRWMSTLDMLQSFFPSLSSDTAVDPAPAESASAGTNEGGTDTEEDPPEAEAEAEAEEAEDPEMQKRAKFNQINKFLRDKGKSDLIISEEEIIMMNDLVDLLKPFEVAIKRFEKEKEPTIQHVLPQYFTLKKHVAPRLGAALSPPIVKLRALLDEQLTVKYLPNIKDRHKVGAFLWPMCAELPFLCEEEREQVKATVRQMCEEQRAVMLRRGLLEGPGVSPSPDKRRRTRRPRALSDEEQYAEILGESMDPDLDEVEKYLLTVRTTGKNVKSKDLLKWWKERSADLPILSRVVRMVLATLASSSASERNFSVAGRLISPRRNCLAPETVDVMLFLYNYFMKKKQKLASAAGGN